MKQWEAIAMVNGDGVTYYIKYNFDISEEAYESFEKCINEGVSIENSPYCGEVEDEAEEALDLAGYLDMDSDKPDPNDYGDGENDEDYIADLKEYNEKVENIWDEYSLEYIHIEDPGKYLEFKNRIIGHRIVDCEGVKENKLYVDLGYGDVNRSVILQVSNDGCIEDVISVFEERLEWEGCTSSGWGECYPDYDDLEEDLKERLDFE